MAWGLMPIPAVNRLCGLPAEAIKNIHEEKFLMLLLMLDAQFQHGKQLAILCRACFHQPLQAAVHMMSPADHISNRRASEQTPFRSRVPVADTFVVRIE